MIEGGLGMGFTLRDGSLLYIIGVAPQSEANLGLLLLAVTRGHPDPYRPVEVSNSSLTVHRGAHRLHFFKAVDQAQHQMRKVPNEVDACDDDGDGFGAHTASGR